MCPNAEGTRFPPSTDSAVVHMQLDKIEVPYLMIFRTFTDIYILTQGLTVTCTIPSAHYRCHPYVDDAHSSPHM
jgi:hypothetical protein